MWKCRGCRRQFTARVGTIFEGSTVPLVKWLLAVHFVTASKKGISAHQLHWMLGVTYTTAWFMAHRLRYAMAHFTFETKLDGIVEVDETYVGGNPRYKQTRKGARLASDPNAKAPVVSFLERGGRVRPLHMERVAGATLGKAINEMVDPDAELHTDAAPVYVGIGRRWAGGHFSVNRGRREYVRGHVTTNTAESYFETFKRGVYGTFHHISNDHLHR